MMALRISYQGCKTCILLYHDFFPVNQQWRTPLSSDDDFIDLPSTHARVKRKEWPDQDDLGGMSSKKVGGGTGRTPQKKNSEEMTREEKKKEAARIRQARSRAKKKEDMSDEQHAVEREKNCQNVAKHCAKMVDGRRAEVRGSYRLPKSQQKEAMTEDEQRKGRDLCRLAVANHRKNLPEEQRAVAREKHCQEVANHEQKAVVREKHRQVMAIRSANIPEESMKEKSSKEEVESKKYYDERKSNMVYKRKVRENQSKEEKELTLIVRGSQLHI